MKRGTKVVLTIFSVIVIVLSVLVLLAALGVINGESVVQLTNGLIYTEFRYIWAIIAGMLIVLAIVLLFVKSEKTESVPQSVQLVQNFDGSVKLTVAAIEELAQRYFMGVPGLCVAGIKVIPLEATQIRIDVKTAVKAGVEIPEITERVIKELAEFMLTYSGLTAADIEITVIPLKTANGK